jgi:hypothetical protein
MDLSNSLAQKKHNTMEWVIVAKRQWAIFQEYHGKKISMRWWLWLYPPWTRPTLLVGLCLVLSHWNKSPRKDRSLHWDTYYPDFEPTSLCSYFLMQLSSTNKTDHHDINEILLKVALNTINQTEITSCLKMNMFLLRSVGFRAPKTFKIFCFPTC